MKTIIALLTIAFAIGLKAQDYTYSTNIYPSITEPVMWYAGTNGSDTNADNFHTIANKLNGNTYLFWRWHLSTVATESNDVSQITTNFNTFTNRPTVPLLSIPSNTASTFGYADGLIARSIQGGTNYLNVSLGSNLWGRVLLDTNGW